jgi:Uma2 family endonuclease
MGGRFEEGTHMGHAVGKPHTSFVDYMAGEQDGDVKHEWFDGAVYAMSRGTPEHARLCARIARVVGNALEAHGEIFSSDVMLYVADVNLSTYADASVVCGPLETFAVKRGGRSLGEAVTNPTVIVEVLSDSTERYDREEKFAYYRRLPSLREYVLVSQNERHIEVFRRPEQGEGRWECEAGRSGETVTIHGATVAGDEVYGSAAKG